MIADLQQPVRKLTPDDSEWKFVEETVRMGRRDDHGREDKQ